MGVSLGTGPIVEEELQTVMLSGQWELASSSTFAV